MTSIYPTSGSLKGGTIVTISGHGFAARGVLNTIHVGAALCMPRLMINYHCKPHGYIVCDKDEIHGYASAGARHFAKTFDFSNDTVIECEIARPASSFVESTVDVRVGISKASFTLPGAYSFAAASTPVITSVDPPVAAPGTQIWLRGNNLVPAPLYDQAYYMDKFGFYSKLLNRSVWVGPKGTNSGPATGFACHIEYDKRSQTWTDPNTHGDAIVCTIVDMAPGEYEVTAMIFGLGYARVDVSFLVGLHVTSMTTRKGSWYGGSLVTVNGVGFSVVPSHNQVTLRKGKTTAMSMSSGFAVLA